MSEDEIQPQLAICYTLPGDTGKRIYDTAYTVPQAKSAKEYCQERYPSANIIIIKASSI